MPAVGLPEMLVVLVVALLVLGPKRPPEAGRGLGRGLRELKDGMRGIDETSSPEEIAASTSATAQSQ